jgi:hypothetical protein
VVKKPQVVAAEGQESGRAQAEKAGKKGVFAPFLGF